MANDLFFITGNCRSLSLDLVDQVENLDKTGQFRFTPPTHTILAFSKALDEFWAEGGLEGRARRYTENRNILKEALGKMGFKELVPDAHAGYIITSYICPNDANFDFKKFYSLLSDQGTYSCNNITTTLIQISPLFYFGFFSKTNHQMII